MVIIGDVNTVRLAHAKAQGFEIADLSLDTPLHERIAALLSDPGVVGVQVISLDQAPQG